MPALAELKKHDVIVAKDNLVISKHTLKITLILSSMFSRQNYFAPLAIVSQQTSGLSGLVTEIKITRIRTGES
jgi:hypothetical protein